MDSTQWTLGKCLYITGIAVVAVVAAGIISHFTTNHTQTSLRQIISTILPFTHTEKNPSDITETITVQNNDTLASIFHEANLPSTLWMSILKLPHASQTLHRLTEGETFKITTTLDHEFLSMTYRTNHGHILTIDRRGTHYRETTSQVLITKGLQFKTAVVHQSLQQAEKATGLPINLEQELTQMLANSSMVKLIQPGDRIDVLYHEYSINNHADHPGNIVAAEITDKEHHHYRVVRYVEPDHITGYYRPNGQGTKPSFLKYPLHYERIGSRFNYHRYDPILHRVRPHLGVDFDAPTGTPVEAISNGIVVMEKQMRGYGNVLMIQYNHTYKTLYAHLEKFSRNIHLDQRVKKGEIVGYVGMTGWSTGPHLHYSVYKNGIPVNPLTVAFPNSSPIPACYRGQFLYKADHWLSEMQLFESASLLKDKNTESKKHHS